MPWKNIIFLMGSLVLTVDSFSQINNDTVAYVYKYPVKEGYIYLYKESSGRLVNPVPYVYIYSKENEIFAFMDGKVVKTFTMSDGKDFDHVIVKKKDTAVIYGNLSNVYKKVGDTVCRGELIGNMKSDIDVSYNRYKLIFGILVGVKAMIYPEYIDFLKKY